MSSYCDLKKLLCKNVVRVLSSVFFTIMLSKMIFIYIVGSLVA